MPDVISCPSCQRKLRVPENLQGQPVKCPACATTFQPMADQPARPPERPRDEDRPSRGASSRSREDEDYEEDRPRRRFSREDDDYEDRPRRRRRHYDEHRGVLILVLGICAIVGVFSLVTGPMAWILGSNDLREIRAGRMDPEGESQTRIGMILGMISCILMILLVLLFCVIAGFLFLIA